MNRDLLTIAALYLAVMAFKALLFVVGGSASSPIETVQIIAVVLGALGGCVAVLSLYRHWAEGARAAFLTLGIGHIAYAVLFTWLYAGSSLGYSRAVVSFMVGIGMLAFARGVSGAQPTLQADRPLARPSA